MKSVLIVLFSALSVICGPQNHDAGDAFQILRNSSEEYLEIHKGVENLIQNDKTSVSEEETWDPVYISSLRWIIFDILRWLINPSWDGTSAARGRNLRCVAIVGDSSHEDLLGLTSGPMEGFQGTLPSIVYRVDDKEDLENPGNETVAILRRIVKDGCGTFVVLVRDGNRTGSLLKFGDRYRELDTRANFVLLYDPNLFRPEFQCLWRKIVNVIFLRAHLSSSTPWFELLTVSFPLFDNKTKLVDIWSRGEFRIGSSSSFGGRERRGSDLFPEKTKELQGKSLAVFTFDHVPSAIKDDGFVENSTSAFHGIEIRILETLAESMNFRIQLIEIGSDEKWGSVDDNGNWTGLFGAVSRGEVDIALGNLFYTPYYLDRFDLTIPYTAQCLTFLTPESRSDNSWVTLILPFKGPTWGAIISALIVGGFLFRSIAAIGVYRKRTGRRPGSRKWKVVNKESYPFTGLNDAILYSWGMLLQVPPPTLPSSWPLRFLSGCWWLFCLLAAVAYRSSMTAVLSSPPPRLVYDTLSDLAASGFSSGGWGDQPKSFFSTALDAPSRRLAKHFEVLMGAEASPQSVAGRVADGHFAYYENEYWLRDARAKYLRGDGRNGTAAAGPYGLHVMRECAINMPVSVGLRDNSPLKARVDQLLRRVIEAGLIGKWLTDAMKPTLIAERNHVAQGSPEEQEAVEGVGQDNSEGNGESKKALMNLRKMYGAILALGLGYLMGFAALVSEIVYHRRFGKKKIGLGPWINYKHFQKSNL